MCRHRVVTEWNFSISRLPLGAIALACALAAPRLMLSFSAETHGEERRPTKRYPACTEPISAPRRLTRDGRNAVIPCGCPTGLMLACLFGA
jgi:hypothetical protein